MGLDLAHLYQRLSRNEGYAATLNVLADGRSHGEIAGDLSLKGSGVAAGVACWQWCALQYAANMATADLRSLPHRTDIAFRLAC